MKIGDVTTLTFTDKTAASGVKYTYKVRAYYASTSTGSNAYGAYNSTKSITK